MAAFAMSSPLLQAALPSPAPLARSPLREHAVALLAAHRVPALAQDAADEATRHAGIATSLMEAFRRSRDAAVFECLAQWVTPHLLGRVRVRLRGLGHLCEPAEVLQDALVNIYRYPQQFLASRAGAFAAWSTTIVDNAIRRRLRRSRRALDLTLQAPDVMAEQADAGTRAPDLAAADHEDCTATAKAFELLLHAYLQAFATLSPREQYVLQEVEVEGVRYAALAARLAVRAEAIKMIVFRARKRILDRAAAAFAAPQAPTRPARASA